jgi:hypothetical protein
MSRTRLTGDLDLFVSEIGVDTNDGSEQSPWRSLQKAWDAIRDTLDLAGHKVTVNIAPGNYGPLYARGAVVGSQGEGSIVFTGNLSAPWTTCVTNIGTGDPVGHAVAACTDTAFTVQGVQVSGTACGVVSMYGLVYLKNIGFGPCGWAHMQAVGPRSVISMIAGTYYINGASQYHALSEQNAFVIVPNCSGVFYQPFTFNTFAHANQGAVIDFTGTSFSGTAVGKKFDVRSGGGVSVNGLPDYVLPGHSAGTCASGGWYA